MLERLKQYAGADLKAEIAELREMVDYLLYENSRMSALLRYVVAPVVKDLPIVQQTRQSFDFQWNKIPTGRFMLGNKDFEQEAPGYVCQFTELPADWFRGKKVVDIGCGAGRYSWALATLGAEVLSLDQSDHALQETARACAAFPGHRTQQIDLLKPLPVDEQFDLVWCFGVLHHTGDTYGAFRNILPLVKPDGYLFMMLYGEPRKGYQDDFSAVNEYEIWREKTRNMTLDERLNEVRKGMEEHAFMVNGEEYINGYFDAISPTINDLYRWDEIEGWLIRAGFTDIKRTVDTRNHHVIAKKS